MAQFDNPDFLSNLDARPDRLDLRDRWYQPPLMPVQMRYPALQDVALFFNCYSKLVLNQGTEGACTGYGLAAVINYQSWFHSIAATEFQQRALGKSEAQIRTDLDSNTSDTWIKEWAVSPTMLYQMARLYDEWDGEDYEGSSCRGAMRGWHHHGVCLDHTWPKGKKGLTFETEKGSRYRWLDEAAARPLGAYYRITAKSLSDMQAAIQQVNAIFAAAQVHPGWKHPAVSKKTKGTEGVNSLPVIEWDGTKANKGGHAFAIVGYDETGFVVQNSWGRNWGHGGFAILTYADWLANAYDAWACVYGAKSENVRSPRTKSQGGLLSQQNIKSSGKKPRDDRATSAWSDYGAALHSIVLGKDGMAQSRMIQAADGLEQLKICAEKRLLRLTPGKTHEKKITLLIYAHSGLLGEEATLRRSAVLAPYFMANNIYPLFISWNAGLLDDLESQFRDAVATQMQRDSGIQLKPSELERRIKETSPYTWEAIASSRSIRAIWNERKDLSHRAGNPFTVWKRDQSSDRDPKHGQGQVAPAMNKSGGLYILAENLRNLRSAASSIDIHLAGHSAGVFVIGSLLKAMKRHALDPKSVTLWAPACSMRYAAETFLPRGTSEGVPSDRFFLDICSRDIDDDDKVAGLYRGSFLKLVSRALEARHKTPAFGLQSDWTLAPGPEQEARSQIRAIFGDCRTEVKNRQTVNANSDPESQPAEVGVVPTGHCTLDQSIEAIGRLIERIRPDRDRQIVPVTDLRVR